MIGTKVRPGRSRSPASRAIRVAVYTRKSVSEGLDQAFNTLDAQREAIEAYVTSQRGQGWEALPVRYDDGGFTGANTDRPAFQRLLADVNAGDVDVVATYKLDRLSRSLLDFAQLMKLFEAKGVAFVSVTETFDTSTPMGRMVLNLLATFAQFERETTAQRTKDKMLASRRRGMWTGGRPVLGYDVVDKRLVINAREAERVRAIFELYLGLGSLIPVVEELNRRHWTTKSWTNKAGTAVDGRSFTKTTLYGMLTNPLYLGRVRAGDDVVDGEHEAIIDERTWNGVQRALHSNRQAKPTAALVRDPRSSALLSGLVRCRCGSSMVHTYTKKGTRQYSYYVCSKAQKAGAASCPGSRVAQGELESFVVEQLQTIGHDPAILEATLKADREARAGQRSALITEESRLRTEQARIERERKNIVDAVAKGGAGEDALMQKLAEQDEALQKARDEHGLVATDLATLDSAVVDPGELRAALADLFPVWAELFPRERARLLALLVESVEFDAEAGEVEITFRPGGPRAVASSCEAAP